MLPPYIYRMIDHIYLSDSRGFMYRSHFDELVNTDGIEKSGPLLKKQDGKTIFLSRSKGTTDQTLSILEELKHKSADHPMTVLLYGEDLSSVCKLFVSYLKINYHFTKDDIQRIMQTGKYPMSLSQCIQSHL